MIWKRDVRCFYYCHGPLARTEIGDNLVQGLDYAYTIHGWLKGVNSSALNSNKDMGRDGDSGPHKFVGTDAMGFILDYYEGDYSPINTGVASFIATPTTSGGYNFITPDLFNGNIRAMSTAPYANFD
ncbi:MAG: hypothetical protein IPL12_14075 [Bacteroidetes bacterium]|nr:hypothetical protein [Bacteroidota bacterium]